MFSFEQQFIKTDVTAVKILKNHYIAGVGGYVHVFDKKCRKFLAKHDAFEGQKIYGIIPNRDETKILLYGSRYIKVILTGDKLAEESRNRAPDWILAAAWIHNSNSTQIVTVSMHNRVQVWSDNLKLLSEAKCEEKCILYSAFVCYDKLEELVILSGTVFSEVLIWRPNFEKDSPVLKRLQRHKGVIFSVHYNAASGYISSSSDDRSTVVWKPKSGNLLSELVQETGDITVACHVFGHLARVFRCLVLRDCFVTAGEDSLLNIWSFDGELVRKVETHQGGPVWAIDADESSNVILTGGSDSGVTLFPINYSFDAQQASVPHNDVPKTVGILQGNNLVVFSESGTLYYYTVKQRKWMEVTKLLDLKTYALVTVSKCRNLVALAGFHGQVYIYRQENDALQQLIVAGARLKSRIFSLHWVNCTTFLICQTEGRMTLYSLQGNKMVAVSNFILPPSKERWSTTAVFKGNCFVIGDRKGHLHLFQLGKEEPVQTLRKVHSHLGVTKLIIDDTKVVSLGRNAVIKTFLLQNDVLQLTSTDKLPFTWLLDVVAGFILAFSGDKFLIWDHKTKRIVFEKSCGGGHRSWDFLPGHKSTFTYIKDKTVHILNLRLNELTPIDLIEGYQVKEINSVGAIRALNNYVIVSGGEDTNLRINVADSCNFVNVVSLKPHLSSIRTITTHKITSSVSAGEETYLVFSGGGRAQVICWKLQICTKDGCITNVDCSMQHSYYKIMDSEESEMRIMDLNVIDVWDKLYLLSACSDGSVKIFSVDSNNGNYFFKVL
ncbi:hypothetical protein NQ315_008637 [Exocentrus adspersus]|uniref:tRNA (34-2'-O)-methyltransferase regulator WDR6 n=1 Tax=Exocentrus adspersus TaxID=1586481 RepID=A0AAV8W6A0_9CUCU|nr:hypothetical protein NQ315_008637 [Exocentrus adspersus]